MGVAFGPHRLILSQMSSSYDSISRVNSGDGDERIPFLHVRAPSTAIRTFYVETCVRCEEKADTVCWGTPSQSVVLLSVKHTRLHERMNVPKSKI